MYFRRMQLLMGLVRRLIYRGKTQRSLFAVQNATLRSTPASRSVTNFLDAEKDSHTTTLHWRKIPGPWNVPILGSIPSLQLSFRFDKKHQHVFWENALKKYGPIFRVHLPAQPPFVAVSNPIDIEVVLRSTATNPVRPTLSSLKSVRYDDDGDYFEKKGGILAENNEEWWRVRSRIQGSLLKTKNTLCFLPKMDEVALEFMDRIALLQARHGEMPPDFQKELYKWALESIGTVALNLRLGCLDDNLPEDSMQMTLIKAVNRIVATLNSIESGMQLWRWFPTRDYKRLKMWHDILVRLGNEYIKKTEASLASQNPHTDVSVMGLLLQTPGLSKTDVRTFILDMIITGIDTTSHSLGFAFYLLAKNKNAQLKLQKEVDSILGSEVGPITSTHINKLSYLKAVVKETLRLYPSDAGTMRQLIDDTVLAGYLVPKGWNVIALNSVASREESVFPRPLEFLPERWMRDSSMGDIHPFAALPFSSGTRMCIGRRLAEQEMYIFLARVMQRYNIDYQYKDIGIVSSMVFMPSEPLKFSFTPRKSGTV